MIGRTSEASRFNIDKFSEVLGNCSKTKDIVFRRQSLRHYIPPPRLQIDQVEEAKLLGVLLHPLPLPLPTLCNRILRIQLVC